MTKKNPSASDPSCFIKDVLQPLMRDRKAMRKRVLKARQDFTFTCRTRMQSPPDIARDCLVDRDGDILYCVQNSVILGFIKGSVTLSPADFLQIALDHGLTGDERKNFVDMGKAYIEYRQAQKAPPPAPPAAKPETAPVYHTPLHRILQEIIRSRYFDKVSKRIYKEKLSYTHFVPAKVTHLKISGTIHSEESSGLINGTYPSADRPPRQAIDKNKLWEILDALDALDRLEEVYAAYDQVAAAIEAEKDSGQHAKRQTARRHNRPGRISPG